MQVSGVKDGLGSIVLDPTIKAIVAWTVLTPPLIFSVEREYTEVFLQ